MGTASVVKRKNQGVNLLVAQQIASHRASRPRPYAPLYGRGSRVLFGLRFPRPIWIVGTVAVPHAMECASCWQTWHLYPIRLQLRPRLQYQAAGAVFAVFVQLFVFQHAEGLAGEIGLPRALGVALRLQRVGDLLVGV